MKYLQKKYALSEQGAKNLFKGIIYSASAYISLMLPVALLAYVLNAFSLRPCWAKAGAAPTPCRTRLLVLSFWC